MPPSDNDKQSDLGTSTSPVASGIHGKPAIPDHEPLKLIGRGSYGEVWLARNVMGSLRAIKVIYRDVFDHDRPYEREFEGIRKFEPISRSDPSQVSVLHVGRGVRYFYYVMELADDASSDGDPSTPPNVETYAPRTLKSEMNRRAPLPIADCIELGMALTTALAHLHKSGLVHRDIKPSNIIYVNGVPKLADIGLVCTLDATESHVGTIGFAPPEMPGTTEGDIYSLGKVLYEAATGRDRQEFPELPTRLGGTAEQQDALIEFNELLLKACETNPRDRYRSAEDMHSDLMLLGAGKSLVRLRTVERRFSRLKRASAVIGLLSLLATVGFFVTSLHARALRKLVNLNSALARRSQEAELDSRRRLVQLQVSKGTEFMNEGDLGQALAWFSAALPNVRDDPDANEIHRIRIGSILENYPKLTRVLAQENPVFRCQFTPDGSRLITHSPNVLKVYNLTAGELEFSLTGTNNVNASRPDSYSPAIVFNADGSRAIIRGLIQGVSTEIFDLKRKQQLFPTNAAITKASAVIDCTDGKIALVQLNDTTAQLFDLDTGESVSPPIQAPGKILTGRLSQHNGSLALHFREPTVPGGETTGSGRNRIQVWDPKTGRPMGPALFAGAYEAESDGECRFLLLNEGKEVFVMLSSGPEFIRSVRKYTVKTGDMVENNKVAGICESVIINASNQWVVVALSKGGKRLENPETGEKIDLNCSEIIRYFTFSPDGLLLATASEGRTVRIWSRARGVMTMPALRHSDNCYGVSFSPDGAGLATCSEDHTVRLWDLTTSPIPKVTLRTQDPVVDAAYSPDGAYIATVTPWVTSTRVWDTASGRPRTRPLTETAAMAGIAFSPDGTKLLATGKSIDLAAPTPGAFVWQAEDWDSKFLWLHQNAILFHARFSPDSERIVTAGSDRNACVWDATNGKLLLTLSHSDALLDSVFTPDGTRLATLPAKGPIRLWNSQSGDLVREFGAANAAYKSIAFSPTGRYFAAGGSDERAYVWDLSETNRPPRVFWQGGTQLQVKFGPTEPLLLTFSHSSEIKIWDFKTGQGPVAELRDADGTGDVGFSPNKRFFVSWRDGGSTSSVRLWDSATGEQLSVPLRHGEHVSGAMFNPKSDEFLSAGSDGAVRIWKWGKCAHSVGEIEDFAAILFCHSLENTGAVTPISPQELSAKFARLRRSHPDAFIPSQAERLLWEDKMASGAERSKRWGSALQHLSNALALSPSSQTETAENLFFRRGVVNSELGHLSEAKADFERAVELDPDRIIAWECLLGSLLAQNLSNEYSTVCGRAFDHFSWATTYSTTRSTGWKFYLSLFAGRMPNAITNYDVALNFIRDVNTDSRSPQVVGALGKLLYRAGRIDEAARELERANALSFLVQPEYLFPLAMAYEKLGRFAEARKVFERGRLRMEEEVSGTEAQATWHHRAIENSFRAEAESVLQISKNGPSAAEP